MEIPALSDEVAEQVRKANKALRNQAPHTAFAQPRAIDNQQTRAERFLALALNDA